MPYMFFISNLYHHGLGRTSCNRLDFSQHGACRIHSASCRRNTLFNGRYNLRSENKRACTGLRRTRGVPPVRAGGFSLPLHHDAGLCGIKNLTIRKQKDILFVVKLIYLQGRVKVPTGGKAHEPQGMIR